MRPDASHDPSVELVEELSDVGTFVILAPTSQERVQRFDQLLGRKGHAPLRALPHLILETPDRFPAWVGIQPARARPAADLRRRKIKFLPTLDLVTEELKPVLDMNDSRLLRMQFYTQLFQDAASGVDGCSRLCRGLAGDYPIVRVPRQLISLVPHLPIKRRQEDVAEQGGSYPALSSPALCG